MQNEEVDWAICTPTPFLHSPFCLLPFLSELKPQQTGTGLLIRYGEVATTSGSTNFLPGRLISRTSPFEGERGGASPSPAANFRSVVK